MRSILEGGVLKMVGVAGHKTSHLIFILIDISLQRTAVVRHQNYMNLFELEDISFLLHTQRLIKLKFYLFINDTDAAYWAIHVRYRY